MNCPKCGSEDLQKKGMRAGRQRYRCKSCSSSFTEGVPYKEAPKYEVLDKVCPHCGTKYKSENENDRKGFPTSVMFILIVIFVAVIFLIMNYNKKDYNNSTSNIKENTNEIIENENEIKNKNEFDKIKKSNNYSIVVVISNNCPYCEIFKPILEDVVQEYNVNIYYLNIDSNFYNSVDLDTSVYATPTIVIYKNGKVINNIMGYKEKNDLINILKKNGVIK